MSQMEDGKEEGTHKKVLSPITEMHEVERIKDTATIEFWVTASTRVSNFSPINQHHFDVVVVVVGDVICRLVKAKVLMS